MTFSHQIYFLQSAITGNQINSSCWKLHQTSSNLAAWTINLISQNVEWLNLSAIISVFRNKSTKGIVIWACLDIFYEQYDEVYKIYNWHLLWSAGLFPRVVNVCAYAMGWICKYKHGTTSFNNIPLRPKTHQIPYICVYRTHFLRQNQVEIYKRVCVL